MRSSLGTFFIPAFPRVSYIEAHYDPLWTAAAEAGTPLCLHRTFGGVDPMDVEGTLGALDMAVKQLKA